MSQPQPALPSKSTREPSHLEPPSGQLRVLLVDAQASDRETVRTALQSAGMIPYEIFESASAAAALAELPSARPDAIVLDCRLPDQDGIALLEVLANQAPDAALIMLSGQGDEKTAVRAMKAGAADYLVKDQALRDPLHLDWAIYTAVYTKRLERENQRLLSALQSRNQELEKLNKRLWELSLTDELTGFHNRRYISARLEEELARCVRYHVPLSLVLMDLDHFKEVNDHYGHLEGDRVLREVSRVVRESLRDTDLAGRFGGEEFLLVLTNTDLVGAESFSNRIRERLAHHDFSRPGYPLRMTASFGIAAFSTTCGSAADLLHAADQNLYVAKGQGRNRVVATLPAPPGKSASP
jgi:diguanylate cyclase (GGDEF)-like protein